MYQKILVATDGSTLSEKAISSALELASEHHCELFAMTVIPRVAMNYFDGSVLAPEDIAQAEAGAMDTAHQLLDNIAKRAREAAVSFTSDIAVSDTVASAIIASAARHGCDLVVMASHGRKGIARMLMGSHTDDVLTTSTLPVLVVH